MATGRRAAMLSGVLHTRSLTWRLVATVVALVLLVTLLVGTVSTLAVRASLNNQLDGQVARALDRARSAPLINSSDGSVQDPQGSDSGPDKNGPDGRDDGRDGGRGDIGDRRGQAVSTLTALWPSGGEPVGDVIVQGRKGTTSRVALSTGALAAIDELPADEGPQTVDLPGLGSYRVAVDADSGDGKVAAGLPTRPVTNVVADLVVWQVLLTLLGGALALAGGVFLVRRQLRPLRDVASTAHDVAALPLAEGDIQLAPRVPDHLTDEATEVGRVGGALNRLLDHVEASLAARHRSEQQVRQFVADASHELRTPLATIGGYAELARRRPDDEEALRTALGKVEEESRRMTSLVEDLLLLARLDAGRPLARAPVDLTRLLVEAVADARVIGPDHRWRLDLPDDPVEVVGDEQRLHQVVSNLLTNARRHTPAGTVVTVAARPSGFTVHDDGPGFPPDLLGRAFERFTRADAARHREGGTGLGLAIVEAVVSAQGGDVTITSSPGDTLVQVTLPPA
jgi:two-component system, OmpR family, sensor kinase